MDRTVGPAEVLQELERILASRRFASSEKQSALLRFLTEEALRRAQRILGGLVIYDQAVARNLAVYGTFAATERLLMTLVKQGADRQQAHEWIRQISQKAWAAVVAGKENPLVNLLAEDARIGQYLPPVEIHP